MISIDEVVLAKQWREAGLTEEEIEIARLMLFHTEPADEAFYLRIAEKIKTLAEQKNEDPAEYAERLRTKGAMVIKRFLESISNEDN